MHAPHPASLHWLTGFFDDRHVRQARAVFSRIFVSHPVPLSAPQRRPLPVSRGVRVSGARPVFPAASRPRLVSMSQVGISYDNLVRNSAYIRSSITNSRPLHSRSPQIAQLGSMSNLLSPRPSTGGSLCSLRPHTAGTTSTTRAPVRDCGSNASRPSSAESTSSLVRLHTEAHINVPSSTWKMPEPMFYQRTRTPFTYEMALSYEPDASPSTWTQRAAPRGKSSTGSTFPEGTQVDLSRFAAAPGAYLTSSASYGSLDGVGRGLSRSRSRSSGLQVMRNTQLKLP